MFRSARPRKCRHGAENQIIGFGKTQKLYKRREKAAIKSMAGRST